MAVYFVTGKLGSGKTLASVGRIRDYLASGRPVATNLDLKLPELVGPRAKSPIVYRLPDKPSLCDLEAIGKGNESYDESRNGLVVLDECGTWFNSRTWGDKERQAIINWFLHARKLGWDLIFIVQSIAIVDKQARLTLAEHVVYCRRLDKITIPFVSSIWKLLFGSPLRLPQIHMAIVKYGDQPTSLSVDRWWYLGHDLYPAYDTKQAFSDFYEHATYQQLSPWLSRGRYMVQMTWRNKLRITKIYWKRFSNPVIAGLAFLAGVLVVVMQDPEPVQPVSEPIAVAAPVDPQSSASVAAVIPKPAPEPERPIQARYASWSLSGYLQSGDRISHSVRAPDGSTHPLASLTDVDAIVRNRCHVRILNRADIHDFVDLRAPNCRPEDLPPVFNDADRVLAHVPGYVRPADSPGTGLRVHGITNLNGSIR